MARIQGADRGRLGFLARIFTRVAYFLARRRVGRVPEPLRLAAHRPRLLLGVGTMEEGLAKSRALDASLKALAGLRAATRIGCVF